MGRTYRKQEEEHVDKRKKGEEMQYEADNG